MKTVFLKKYLLPLLPPLMKSLRCFLFYISLIMLLTITAHGEQITQQNAMHSAQTFLRHQPQASATDVNLSLAYECKRNENAPANFYVYNKDSGKGFVIVAGDNRVTPVLGYSDEGCFDKDNIPGGLQQLLEMYENEIEYLRSHPEIHAVPATSQLTTSVMPLLKTRWRSNTPFNNMCPSFTYNGRIYHADAGQAAIAAAQIMNYHRWPEHGSGSVSYSCTVFDNTTATIEADFENYTYDWDNIMTTHLAPYSTLQAQATAQLVYHVGAAARMQYVSYWSLTDTHSIYEALLNNFGYSKAMRVHNRMNYSSQTWEALIRNELDNSRPVFYSGYGGSSVSSTYNAFVVDGYNANGYFHVNWGVGEYSNGFFLLHALNYPVGNYNQYDQGYNYRQQIITGICPDDGTTQTENYVEMSYEHLSSPVPQVELGNSVKMNIYNLNVEGHGCEDYDNNGISYVSTNIAFRLTDLDNNFVEQTEDACELRYGIFYDFSEASSSWSPSYTPSTTLANGDYKLWFMYKMPSAGHEDYICCSHLANLPDYLTVHVADGVMYFDAPENSPNLTLQEINAPEEVSPNCLFHIDAILQNDGDPYIGNIYFAFMHQNAVLSKSEGYLVIISNQEDQKVERFLKAPATPGQYQLVMLDARDNMIGEPLDITVDDSDFKLYIVENLSCDPFIDANDFKASFIVKNAGTSDYHGVFRLLIKGLDQYGTVISTPVLTVPAGTTQKIDFASEFYGLPGYLFYMYLLNPASADILQWGNSVYFILNDYYTENTSISSIEVSPVSVEAHDGTINVTGASKVEVYDTMGKFLSRNSVSHLPSGLYIVVADGKVYKVVLK